MLAIWYFTVGNIEEVETKTHINSVSLSSQKKEPKAQQNKLIVTEDKNPENPLSINELVLDSTVDKDRDNTELDYITAYRDWQYFENCYTDVEDFHNRKDPLDTLKERFENNPREAQIEPTAQQNSYYQQHVDICKGLIEDDEDDYYSNRSRLESVFRNIIAKTEVEKQLEKSLQMVEELKQARLNYTRSNKKTSSLAPSELKVINLQINDITERMLNLYDSADELNEEENLLLQQYSHELDVLNKQITSHLVIDEDALNQANLLIEKHLGMMDAFLKTNTSPDAFLLIAGAIYKAEYYQKDMALISHLKRQTGIWDSYYINVLNRLVLPLVACSMNYPCDAESDYMLSYCLGLRDSMFNQACGLGLEDFYFDFYIGANQLDDVNTYFQYLTNRYAQ